MLVDIEPIGGYLKISSDGYIVNDCQRSKIPDLWMEPVNDVVAYYQRCHKENLASVYLRGSIPRGTMINSISDIDSFCLTHTEACEDISLDKYQCEFARRYRFVNGVEIDSYVRARALQMASMRFLLKTQCLCIDGVDVLDEIEPMGISVDCFNTCLYLSNINDNFLGQAASSDSVEDALDLCSWIFKASLRAAFEIVMFRENRYTRDIYFCWASYSAHYPEHADILRQALYRVLNPSSDINEITELWNKIFSLLRENVRNNEHLLE